jgi:BirA family biotin operon repressor/biotin-[acetyl-CoA-carboxylase] ligase
MPVSTEALAAELGSQLTTARLGRAATVLGTASSTQDLARQMAASGAPEGTMVWALEQTMGRGRLDRAWASPAGAGLWFSVVLRPHLAPPRIPWLTLAAGVACADALGVAAGAEVRLKWPNDLLLGGAKVGGILAEAESLDGALAFVVLGVGINLNRPAAGFDPDIKPPPAALEDAGRAPLPTPAELLAAVLAELETAYDALGRGELEATRMRWLALSDTIGRRVTAQLDGGAVEGLAVGLGEDGALLVDGDDGRRLEVRYGEVIHLR